jgi:hypothetical protein
MKLSRYQQKLLALLKQHGPIFVHSAALPVPLLMLDAAIWADSQAREALYRKGLVRWRDDGKMEAT